MAQSTFDVAQFLTGNPDIVMTNGMAQQVRPGYRGTCADRAEP